MPRFMQNALRRRELNQLNVCQDECRSFRQTKFDRSVFMKFDRYKFTMLTLTVKKPKEDGLSYALFPEPAGECPFCQEAGSSLLQVQVIIDILVRLSRFACHETTDACALGQKAEEVRRLFQWGSVK